MKLIESVTQMEHDFIVDLTWIFIVHGLKLKQITQTKSQ